jgi:hypothetical protein
MLKGRQCRRDWKICLIVLVLGLELEKFVDLGFRTLEIRGRIERIENY